MAYPPPTAPASLSGMPPSADCYCCMPGWLAMALRLSDSLVEAGGQRKWGKSLQVDTPSRNMFYYCSSRLRPLASGSHSSAAGEARERRRKKRIPAQLLPNLVLRSWARSFAQSSTCPPPPHPFRSLPDPDNPISVSLVQPIPNKHGAAVLFSGSFHPPVPLLWNLHALFDVEGERQGGEAGRNRPCSLSPLPQLEPILHAVASNPLLSRYSLSPRKEGRQGERIRRSVQRTKKIKDAMTTNQILPTLLHHPEVLVEKGYAVGPLCFSPSPSAWVLRHCNCICTLVVVSAMRAR